MKFYGYENTKINRILGIPIGGKWVKIGFFKFVYLWCLLYWVRIEIRNIIVYERYYNSNLMCKIFGHKPPVYAKKRVVLTR